MLKHAYFPGVSGTITNITEELYQEGLTISIVPISLVK